MQSSTTDALDTLKDSRAKTVTPAVCNNVSFLNVILLTM